MNKIPSLYSPFMSESGKFSDCQNDLEDFHHFLNTLNDKNNMNQLIKILETAKQKHGSLTPLTIGHLINICKMDQNLKTHEEEAKFIKEQKQHNEIMNWINPLGQD